MLFTCLLFPGALKGTHIYGGDIGWEAVGKDSLKVTVTLYRDCNNVKPFNNSLNISSSCGNKTITGTFASLGDITPVCTEQCTRCKSSSCSFTYGLEKYELTAIIDVSSYIKSSCCELTMSWSRCCRPGSVLPGSNKTFYLDAMVNLCNGPLDNSPKFIQDPLHILCKGRNYVYNNGAIDHDGDSLVHSFGKPMESATKALKFSSPYSHEKPLFFFGMPNANLAFPKGIHLDPLTGDLSFRPMKEEVGVITIDVKSYRNNKLNARTKRDMSHIVIKCPDNNPPVLSGIDCAAPEKIDAFTMHTCEGQELKFKICQSDLDRKDSVDATAFTSDIKGYKISTNCPPCPRQCCKTFKGEFSWTPDSGSARQQPYFFNVFIADDACPVPGVTSKTYKIYVYPDTLTTVTPIIKVNKNCNVVRYDAVLSNNLPITGWEWYEDNKLIGTTQSGQYESASAGQKKITVVARRGGCEFRGIDTIQIDSFDQVFLPDPADTVLCSQKEITVDLSGFAGNASRTFHYGVDSFSYSGSDSIGLVSLKKAKNPATVVYGISSNGCEWSRSLNVTMKRDTLIDVQKDLIFCSLDNGIALKVLPTNQGWGEWTGTGTYASRYFNGRVVTDIENTVYYKNYDDNHCISDTALITILQNHGLPESDTFNTCTNHDTIPLIKPGLNFKWRGQGVNVDRFYLPDTVGQFPLSCIFDLGNNCTDSIKLIMNIDSNKLNVDLGFSDTLCRDSSNLLFCLSPSLKGGLFAGSQIDPGSGCINTQMLNPGVHAYLYTLIDSQFCKATDSLQLSIGDAVKARFTASKTLGRPPLKVTFSNQSKSGNYSSYWWFGNPGDSVSSAKNPSFTYTDTGSFDVTLLVKDSSGYCEDQLTRADYIVVDNSIGSEMSWNNKLELFPNPASNYIYIQNLPKSIQDITIHSADGRLVKTITGQVNSGQIDISEIGNGSYILQLKGANSIYLQSFTVIK